MAVLAVSKAVENDFGDGHLATLTLATGLVIHDLGEAAVFGEQLRHGEIGRGRGTRRRSGYCLGLDHRHCNCVNGRDNGRYDMRHLLRTRRIACSGADCGARSCEDHGKRDDQHAVGTMQNLSGLPGHDNRLSSDIGFAVTLLR
jgi:hypothetical protein